MKKNSKKDTKRNKIKQQISRNVIAIILYCMLIAIGYWAEHGAKNPWDCIMKKVGLKDNK
ncbi:MAG: hypothetical protein K0S41_3281 [Anaerocolumna sp.]|jgi:cell division protein FtsB|nr:hypothetical protein [Anaerocolumna sp.]